MQPEGRRYRVLEAVGRGGFGTVYRAALLGPGGFRKSVALKVLNPEVADKAEVASRLRDEARMLGFLQHRAVVRVDGLQRLGDRWALVMEFVEGADLKEVLGFHGPFPLGASLEIVEEIASALDGAFNSIDSAGAPLRLLHRDVKPSNVRLTRGGDVKVLDFGVARADFAERESTTKSTFFGSLAYMAPERLDSIDTHKGDVYGCGAVLYELLVGEQFGRTSANRQRHEAHLHSKLEKLWGVLQDEELYRTVAACLAYEDTDRPDARTLCRHLQSLRRQRGGPWLRDWAEDVVPRVPVATVGTSDEDLSGTILAEDAVAISGSLKLRLARRGPSLRDLRLVLTAALASFVFVVTVGGACVAHLLAQQEAELEAFDIGGQATIEVAPETAREPETLDGTDAATTRPAPPRPASSAIAPAVAPSPPKRARPRARRASVDSSAARIFIAEGASALKLVGRSGEYAAGELPAGTYAVEADFGDGRMETAGTVRVSAGESAYVVCNRNLRRCRKRR